MDETICSGMLAGKVALRLVRGIETWAKKRQADVILYPTHIGIASVTDDRRAFNAATFADVLFTNLLYHEDFPLTDGVGVIREFWVSHANEARIKLLQ